ncbi:sensor histidine kinase [Microscilla marina]|uniref:sensor histidine kinase n=1 Tax=Microscilla marina TaxID=1027 RepID=UPI0006A6BA4C|nr:ATP-binding protein [Microscilla marina]
MKNIKLNILLRFILLLALMGLLMYTWVVLGRQLRSIYIMAFLVLASAEFLWYVDKTNRDLGSFLLALLHNDFTTRFSAGYQGKSQAHLYKSFNAINQKFLELNAEREVLFLHQQMLVEHLNVGIISFDRHGKVHLLNNAFRQILQQPQALLRQVDDLKRVQKTLCEAIQQTKAGERKVIKIRRENDLLQLAIQATEFNLKGKYFKLISAQDIQGALDEQELDAWQKLIKVLTHEIMNSVVPITSLSDTLHLILAQSLQSTDTLSAKTLEDVRLGLDAIRNRSKGLVNFTETYKNLTRIPPPQFAQLSLSALVARLRSLMQPRLEEAQIPLLIDLPDPEVYILADVQLIEQVLLNLIKNAIEALENQPNPCITLQVGLSPEGKTWLKLKDNGPGIAADQLDKIFVPFFTTKPEGSGIGLSLCRQIMRMHKGSLSCHSVIGQGTAFTVVF